MSLGLVSFYNKYLAGLLPDHGRQPQQEASFQPGIPGLCCGLNCIPPQIHTSPNPWDLTVGHTTLTAFGDRVFKEVNQVK